MILFITAQDAPTQDNLVVADHLIAVSTVGLRQDQAVRGNVIAALANLPDQPFFALAHGQRDHLCGHDDEPAVTTNDLALLVGRQSFALACHTAEGLGPEVAQVGGTWIGYVGPVNCLPANPDAIEHFRDIATFLADRFPGCTTIVGAEAFITDLSALTGKAHDAIVEAGTETFELLHALRDVTRRLRIWLPNATSAIKHPEGYGDPLL